MRAFPSRCLSWVFVISMASMAANASSTIVTFSGNTNIAIGSIPGNTPFTGTFTYNASASGVTTSYNGGTETVFSDAYTGLTLTIGGSTVSETVPGSLALFNNVTIPGAVPTGDTLLSFDPLSGANSSTGEFLTYGLTPDNIYLSLVDTTGAAFSGTSLPSILNLAEFTSALVGVDYGPAGAGNTDVVSNLSALKTIPDQPYTAWLMLCAAGALIGIKWKSSQTC